MVIQAESRVARRNELRVLGVDRGSMFADLDGIDHSLNAGLCVVEADELDLPDPPGDDGRLAR